MILTGRIQDGVLLLNDLKLYHKVVHELEGKSIQLELKKLQLDFTEQQNNYYWGVIIRKHCMNHSDFAGWTEREIDHYLGSALRIERIHVRGCHTQPDKQLVSIIPISRLKLDEYRKFIDDAIIYLAMEHTIIVEEPQ